MNWDELVYRISMGESYPHYEELIKTIMSADDREYARLCVMYSDLMDAIDRYKRKYSFMSDVRFERGKGK